MVVVGFFGSRHGCDPSVIQRVIERLREKYDPFIAVVGDCIGVDELVYRFCKVRGIPVGVVAVCGNWHKISYRYDPEDVIEYVGSITEPLRVRLVKRTVRLVEYVRSRGGFLVGINTGGRGSRLAIRTAQRLGVPCYVF